MIPTPPPPPMRRNRRYEYQEFVPIPPGLARHVRITARALGLSFIVAVLAIAIAIGVVAFQLPTAQFAATIFVVFMGETASFFAIFSAITLATGHSYVATGQLNVTQSRKAQRILLILWIASIFPTAISTLFFTGLASLSRSFTGLVLGYLVVLWLPFAVALISWITGRRLFRPSSKLLHKYGAQLG